MTDEPQNRPRDRLPTGVPGLDDVLQGGLLRRGVYMVQGRPGRGKTILTNQICFHHVRSGGRVLYITLLAETHERMLFNLEQLSFFDVAFVPEKVSYVSAFSTLEEGGLKGLLELIRREARTRKASLLVVDGFVAVQERAESGMDFKKIIHELQIHANFLGCTVMLLTSSGEASVGPEHTMVDGVLELSDNRVGRRSERELEVKKFRGSGYLRGGHTFQITSGGVVVYPRLESLLQDPASEDACKNEPISTGIPTLDRALDGGLPCASSTVLFGPTGTGKTTLGMHFLDESTKAEPGLMFSFYETPQRILFKADKLGIGLREKLKTKALELMWQPPTERLLDALGNQIVDSICSRGAKRLFVDGIDGLLKAATYPDRLSSFLSALTNELRILGVTSIYTAELHDLFSTQVGLPLHGISSLVENVVLLRFVEQGPRMVRVFSTVKLRDRDFDATSRELLITSRGAMLGAPVPAGTPARSSKRTSSPATRKRTASRRRK